MRAGKDVRMGCKKDVNKYKPTLGDSNDHEKSTWTRILIEEEGGIGIELREMSKE